MTNRASFGPDTTANEVLEGLDLSGKVALVTGASGGLGLETARALAAKGAQVIVTAREPKKMRAALQAQGAARDAELAELSIEELELGSFDSIRTFAERFLANHDRLDVLINNAGVMACPQATTEDGFELQFGVNHLGHFLMTNLIARALVRGARVVSLSSLAHMISPVVFDDIQFERRTYDKWQAYGQSKTANALFAVGLNARLRRRGVEAFSVHPGAVKTDLSRHQTEADMARRRAAEESGKLTFKSLSAGAATSVYAATAPELANKGGAYLADCRICPVSAEEANFSVVRPYAVDPIEAARLWSVSELMVGEHFPV